LFFSCWPLLADFVRVGVLDALRYVHACLCQCPGVCFASNVALAGVLDQAEAIKARQELGYLSLIGHPRQSPHLTIRYPRMLRDRLQHPCGAIRQTHPRIGSPIRPDKPTPARNRMALEIQPLRLTRGQHRGKLTRPLAPSDSGTPIRQHDHPHQPPKHTHQRLVLSPEQPCVHDRERRAHQTLPSQRCALCSARTLITTRVYDSCEPGQDLLTTLQHPRTTTQRLHHNHPRQHRLTIQKRQDHPQPLAHTLTPPKLVEIRRRQLTLDPLNHALQRREQTILTTIEQVIERAPRHPRTTSHITHRHTRITQLIHRTQRPSQQPRTLNTHHTRTRQTTTTTTTTTLRTHNRIRTPGDQATPPGARQYRSQWACRPILAV
jgi:hypothetical protein